MPVSVKRHRAKVVPPSWPLTGQFQGIRCGTWYHFVNGEWKLSRPDISFNASSYWFTPFNPFISRKVCDDENHGRPPYRHGGPLTIVEVRPNSHEVQGVGTYTTTQPLQTVLYGPSLWRYVGGFLPSLAGSLVSTDFTDANKIFSTQLLVPSLTGWGPVAWAKSAPKIEMASGFVALRESRDLPRMLRTTASGFHDIWKSMGGNTQLKHQAPKKVSDHFLNHQFGWSPFLGDMGKFISAYNNTERYLDNMSRDHDRWRVRRRTLEDVVSDVKLAGGVGSGHRPNFEPTAWAWWRTGDQPTWEVREQVHDIVTSVGAFKFYKPEFDKSNPEYHSAVNTVGRQLTMYGARISPSNIYRSTPWTWLIDWGLNIGRSVDRITEFVQDGVVSKYLYVMRHRVRSLELTTRLPFPSGDVILQHRMTIDAKVRRGADSPYGFGLSWDSLSPRRLAILAALGISRNW